MKHENFLRTAFTPLNLHAGVVILFLIFDLVLLTRLGLAWHEAGSDQTATYNSDLATYAQLQGNAGKLHSLPERLRSSSSTATEFYDSRIPDENSTVIAELGGLAAKNNVRFSSGAYRLVRGIPNVSELQIEGSFAGEYVSLMHFINDLERDKNHSFFTIHTLTLSQQQGGLVDLRLRLTTYLRGDASQGIQTNGNNSGEGQ